ncbi:hypothetical protein [Bacillus sp. JJ722]
MKDALIVEAVRTPIGKRNGLQTMCEGLGMANALIIERLDSMYLKGS